MTPRRTAKVRTDARKDANHNALVDYWLSLGGTWQDTHQVPGALDGIAGKFGIDVRIEIKDGDKPASARKLTEAEFETIAAWRGRLPNIWTTPDDVDRTHRTLLTDSELFNRARARQYAETCQPLHGRG